MPHCAAFGCNFQSKGNSKTEISIHSFPKEKELRKQWEEACGRVDELPKDPRLCSRHFSLDSFEDFQRSQLMRELIGVSRYKRRLKPNAVPTIFPDKKTKRPRLNNEDCAKEQIPCPQRNQETWNELNMCTTSQTQEESLGAAPEDPQTSDSEYTSEETSPADGQSDRTSVSAQCSVRMRDISTQTDTWMSSVAVQSQAYVHSLIMEHNYSGKLKKTLERESVRDPDDSHESEPGFVPNSSSQFTDTQTSNNISTGRVFLVFEDQLKQLLVRCVKCGSPINQEDITEVHSEGSQLTLALTCANKCTYRWQAQPSLSGTKGAGNLLLTASVFLSGIHFPKFERFCSIMNLKTISADTYSELRKRFVFPTIEKTWLHQQNALLSDMKSKEVVLCGNGRYDSNGHSARYCTYTFLDTRSRNVVDFKVVSAGQVSDSNEMRLHGFKEALKTIEGKGLQVSTIATDGHPQIVKEMRVNNPEKAHEFDPWHVAKSVSKKLAAEAKRKDCDILEVWIPSVMNHLWWSAQTCEENAELLKEKWVSVIHHATNKHAWLGNKHYHCCAHGPINEESQRSKQWLKSGSEAYKALVKIVTDPQLLKDLDHITKCVHTTPLEVCNAMFLKYLPQRTHFSHDVMVHASMLAVLEHNNNVNSDRATNQNEEKVGEPKYKISWSKVHKSFRAKPAAVRKDYGYMAAMMADVLTAVSNGRDTSHVNAPPGTRPGSRKV